MIGRLLLLLGLVLAGAAPNAAAAERGRLLLHAGQGRLLRFETEIRNVFVGDSAIADVQVVSPRLLYIYGRRSGETTLSATDAANGIAAQLDVTVDRSAAPAAATLPPGSDVALRFDGNRLVLRGPVRDLSEALETNATAEAFGGGRLPPLDETRLAGAQQVTLRVRIAEVSRSVEDQLGINFDFVANPGSLTVGLLTGSFLGAVPSGLLTGAAASNFGNISVGVRSRRVNGQALLNALQSEGLLTTLAEPNLTTISGETARFLAGGEVPIPVPQALGVTTIDYKRYGVQLEFTPTLLPGDRIALKVHPTVSEISSANAVTIAGTAVPSFIEREAETLVEMASGQTLAIAGLFERNDNATVSKFPGLGDIPILGALFRSTSFQRNETELVILVTPYLTQPVSAANNPLPTDHLGEPARVPAGFVAD